MQEKPIRQRSGRQLHNMSAPPMTTVTVRPLNAASASQNENDSLFADLVQPGFRAVLRLNVKEFIQFHVPQPSPVIDLRRLVVLSRVATGKVRSPTREYIGDIPFTSTEAWTDELLENAGRLDPVGLGLPNFGLAIPIPEKSADFVPAPQGLAVLSRLANGLFLAKHSPYSEIIPPYPAFALVIPVGQEGGET